jgi:phospholipid transport system substrate-binding protein
LSAIESGVPTLRLHARLAACLACILIVCPAGAKEPLSPERRIAELAAQLTDDVAARQEELRADPQALRAMVDELLRPAFDLQSAARLILQQYWRDATPAQRRQFMDAFYHYLIASYGDALLEFRHNTIRLSRDQPPPAGNVAQVRATLQLTGGATYMVDFYMRLDEHGWRVVDVIVENSSYVRFYRTNFGLEVRADGLESLSARLAAVAGPAR